MNTYTADQPNGPILVKLHDFVILNLIKASLHQILKVSMDKFSQFRGILLLIVGSRFSSELMPTLKYSSCRDTTNHVPFIAHDTSNNTAYAEENLLHLAGFELRFLRPQAGVLPIEPPLSSSIV